MSNYLQAFKESIVRVYGGNGGIVGAGFLASNSHILTCAHVVTQALNLPQDTSESPVGSVEVDFPLIAPGQKITAHVVFWRPVQTLLGHPPEDGEDIATLQLESEPPSLNRTIQLVMGSDIWDHPFRIFGFPNGHSDGVWATGKLRAERGNGWVQMEAINVPGYRIEMGFSGAPVWDESLEGVIGMTVAAEKRRESVKAAFMIPTEVLVQACPQLKRNLRMPMSPQEFTENTEADQFLYDAFLSYSHRDSGWIRNRLLPLLEAAGLRICIDYRDFEIGASSLTNMERAVEKSRKTLLVLTPAWMNSEWTTFEALIAQTQDPAGRGRRILPLMVIKTELPKRLEMLTYLDLSDEDNFDFQIKRLINAIQQIDELKEASYQDSKLSDASLSASNSPSKPDFSTGDFNYFQGLLFMNKQIQADANVETRLTFSTLESRLRANLRDESLFGTSETLRSERYRIVYELNRLGLLYLNKTFNEMCDL